MIKVVTPEQVMCGDEIIVNNYSGRVKYIDGPDSIGTYDIHVVDAQGKEHIEIVSGVVTLSL